MDQEIEKPKSKNIKMKKSNMFLASTIILAVALVGVIAFGFMGCFNSTITSAAVAPVEEVGQETVSYLNTNFGTTATLKDSEKTEGMYKLILDLDGQETEIYVSPDGNLIFPMVINKSQEMPSTQQQEPEQKEVPKTEKPEVELHIFSYCPAGSGALDTFAPVANMLKDEADFSVKFFSHMHGDYELQQNMIQECIQQVDKENYWDYAEDFYEEIYLNCAMSGDIECDKNKSISLMEEKGIDSDKVLACVEDQGEELYEQDISRAQELKLSYSPSFVINDVYLQDIDRSSEGIKDTVCSAFAQQPELCEQSLSSQATSAGSC